MILNLEKINKIKRKNIINGLKYIKKLNAKDNIIDKIIIFGSSVRDDCTENSDIDICYVSKYPLRSIEISQFFCDFPNHLKCACDIIPLNEVDGNFKKSVIKNGVLVYEYSKN